MKENGCWHSFRQEAEVKALKIRILHHCAESLAAKNSRYIDDVVVTTDSERIAETAKAYGAEVPFLRPAELASDTAKTIDAVLHAVKWLEDHQKSYDLLVLLQPTQPLRRAEDIDGAIELCIQRDMQDVVSVKEVSEHPILMRTIDEKGELQNVLSMQSTVRRQDMPQYYLVDGSVYVNRIETLSESTSFNDNPIPYIMDAKYSVDIDEPSDLEQAERLLKKDLQAEQNTLLENKLEQESFEYLE